MSDSGVTKRIYFVRHGESVSNVNDIVQTSSDPLSQLGEKQALKIAERSQNIEFDVLISSDYVRAKSTAERISEATKKEIIFSELFREYKRPNSMAGTLHAGPLYQDFLKEELQHLSDPNWRFEDAENFTDARERVISALNYLFERPEKNILVVTHGVFLRMLAGYVLMGGNYTPELFTTMNNTLRIVDNTSVTIFNHERGNWRLYIWNDRAHLAEE